MKALEVKRTRGSGRVKTALGDEPMLCELCTARGAVAGGSKQKKRMGSRIFWLLGYAMIRVCRPCELELEKLWHEMGGGPVSRRRY